MALESKLTEEQLFDQLISSLVHSSWVSLGKIKNPLNDELERNLDQASIQIDMLDMLYKRMSGNLSENEDQYLNHLISELKMNFVEEKNKPDSIQPANNEAGEESTSTASNDEGADVEKQETSENQKTNSENEESENDGEKE